MTVLGSYAIRNNMLDVWIMFSFGVIGYVTQKLRFHPAPIVLGLILGPFVEEGLLQSLLVGGAGGSVVLYMLSRPISLVLIIMCLLSAVWPLYAAWKSKRNEALSSAAQGGER